MPKDNNFDDPPFTEEEMAACPVVVDEPLSRDAPQRSEERISGGGTVLSNTVPPNTKLLNYGIDSIYMSYRGELSPFFSTRLQKLKEDAGNPAYESRAQLYVAMEFFKVHDKGSGFFKYVISNDEFYIRLGDRKSSSTMPFAMVQIRSEYIAKVSPKVAVDKLLTIIQKLGDILDEPKVSRVDIFCDVATDFDMSMLSLGDFITRANNANLYHEKNRFTGVSFGMGGDIAFRLYNKTIEIEKSKKLYVKDIWSQAGWAGITPVWRFEFQIERSILKQFNINTFEDVLTYQNQLWNYLVRDWIRLVVPNYSDSHRDRAETHWLWEFIQKISGHDYTLTRYLAKPVTTTAKRKEIICRYYKIALTELMACDNIDDIQQAHDDLLLMLEASYDDKRRFFDEDIKQVVAKKRRNLNTMLNNTSCLTPPDSCHEDF